MNIATLARTTSLDDVIKIASNDCLKDFWARAEIEKSLPFNFPAGIWYRGQSEESWPLTPSVFRRAARGWYDETSMFLHFQVRSSEYRKSHTSAFGWLCLMQHYGLPTRLLDWSESILVALYFAVRDDANPRDGRLFILNARLLNYHVGLRDDNHPSVFVPTNIEVLIRSRVAKTRTLLAALSGVEISASVAEAGAEDIRGKLERVTSTLGRLESRESSSVFSMDNSVRRKLVSPVAVLPNRSNARTIPQQSTFTVHGGKLYVKSPKNSQSSIQNPVSLVELNAELQIAEQFLTSFVIEGSAKKQIKAQLAAVGIHEGSLFPEIDHQAEYIKDVWQFDRD